MQPAVQVHDTRTLVLPPRLICSGLLAHTGPINKPAIDVVEPSILYVAHGIKRRREGCHRQARWYDFTFEEISYDFGFDEYLTPSCHLGPNSNSRKFLCWQHLFKHV
jgi:hypothetical protein